jgi:membrane protease YdiL (CAAX protease family)
MEASISRVKNYLLLLFVLLVIEFSPRIGSLIADHFQSIIALGAPNHVLSWEIIHHIIQLLIPLAIMIAWPNRSLKDWGFRIGDAQKGWKWVFGFTLAWFGIYVVVMVITIAQKTIPHVYYDVSNTRSLLGELGFRTFIVGLSEETLFRAFPITLLIIYWNRKFNIFRFKISQAGIIAAVLFTYAHIGYYFYPFEIIHFNLGQLFAAAGLGILYAAVFEETKSIWYPIIIHSIADIIPVLGLFVLQFIVK